MATATYKYLSILMCLVFPVLIAVVSSVRPVVLSCDRDDGVSELDQTKGDQGVPGKRGPPGDQGLKGCKGEKGADAEIAPALTSRINEVERQTLSNFKNLTTAVQILQEKIEILGCPLISFRFLRDNQVTDYVRYRSYFPRLTQGTACMWLETAEFNNPRTAPMSYAVPNSNNEWLIELQNRRSISILFDLVQDFASISGVGTGVQKVHVCSLFSSELRQRAFYFNGKQANVRRDVMNRGSSRTANFIRGGGTLILGQDQDRFDANNLDATQAYSGNITNFMIWPRYLSAQEISNIANSCECPQDYAVVMTLDRVELHGAVQYSVTDKCPTL